MRPIREVIIHCTATPEGRDYSVDEIRRWHLARGWKDIGYHRVVHLNGHVEQGRPDSVVGSHVAGHNTGTLGVVYVGGVDAKMSPKDTRTVAQKEALLGELKRLLRTYPTIKVISGHRDYAAKACPCFDARAEYATLIDGSDRYVSPPRKLAIGEGVVTGDGLRLRAEPNGVVITRLAKNTRLSVRGQDGDWLAVSTPIGSRGWVARTFVKIEA